MRAPPRSPTTENAPQQTADRKRTLFDRLRAHAEESVLAATTARRSRKRPTPVDAPEAEQALLDLFLIEKAAYEIRYEAANRPTWIGLPVRGLAVAREPLARRHGRAARARPSAPVRRHAAKDTVRWKRI